MNRKNLRHRNLKKAGTKKKPAYIFFVIGILLIAYIFLFGNHGLIRYFQLQYRKSELNRQIANLKAEQERLQKEIDMLQNNYRYIEKIAREKYQMGKEGEKIYFMIQPAEKNKNQKWDDLTWTQWCRHVEKNKNLFFGRAAGAHPAGINNFYYMEIVPCHWWSAARAG